MAITLEEDLRKILSEEDTVKVLATIDGEGIPHVVVKNLIHTDEYGNLVHLEVLESSRTNKNLVRAIWFGGSVAVNAYARDGQSWQIKGKPVKAHISGPLFESYYKSVREKLGDVDLSTVWIIQPEEVIEESFARRKEEEERDHPLLMHLDRLVKGDSRESL